MRVDFYFSVGSRYSYLAATQVPKLAAETGAAFNWRPLQSRQLIERAGNDPFRVEVRRGQYDPAYRRKDAERWAALYAVPYSDPDWERFDSLRNALACVTARLMGRGEAFARALFDIVFGGRATYSDADFLAAAQQAGLDGPALIVGISSPDCHREHQSALEAAARAGAFGVPSFVPETGEMFWGQDRLPLLRHRLMSQN